jgi:hypothetical protein
VQNTGTIKDPFAEPGKQKIFPLLKALPADSRLIEMEAGPNLASGGYPNIISHAFNPFLPCWLALL